MVVGQSWGFSFVAVFLLGMLGLMVMMGLVLLTFPSTRKAGVALLMIPAFLFVAFFFLSYIRVSEQTATVAPQRHLVTEYRNGQKVSERWVEDSMAPEGDWGTTIHLDAEAPPAPPAAPAPEKPPVPTATATTPAAPASVTPAAGNAAKGKTFQALVASMKRVIEEHGVKSAEMAVDQAKQKLGGVVTDSHVRREASKPQDKSVAMKPEVATKTAEKVATPAPIRNAAASAESSAPRPAWMEEIGHEGSRPNAFPAKVVENVYQMVVTAGPYETDIQCEASLPDAMERGVRQFIARDLGEEAAQKIRLPLDYIESRVARKPYYYEKVNTSIAPMVQVHALMRFDRDVRTRIQEEWSKVLLDRRLWFAGQGLTGVILLLSVAYGYLKTDLVTHGAYRWRLRLLAATLVSTIMVVGMALWWA